MGMAWEADKVIEEVDKPKLFGVELFSSQSYFWAEEYNTRLSHLLRFVSLFTVVTTVQMDLICMKCHSKFISNPQKQKATLRAVYS